MLLLSYAFSRESFLTLLLPKGIFLLPMPLPSKLLAPQIAEFVSKWLSLLPNRDYYPISLYKEMVQSHPKVAIASELRILFMLSLMREYTHPDEEIQAEIRSNFAQMPGSWIGYLLKMLQFTIFGYSFTEKAFNVKKRKATLAGLQPVNQSWCSFEGSQAGVKSVIYNVSGSDPVEIPYENGIHFVNQDYLIPGYDPHGFALLHRAVPLWELHKLVSAAMAIAVQRQATPILVGKTDKTAETTLVDVNGNPLLNQNGTPVKRMRWNEMQAAMQDLENSSVMVIDVTDDILAIAQQTNGDFFRSVLYYLDASILWCFLISPVIAGTSESGVGDSSLIDGHLKTLFTVARTQMKMVGDQLIEQLVKPILDFNYGQVDNYGEFPVPQEENPNTIDLLNAISNGVRYGTFSASDEAVLQRAKDLAEIKN